MDDAVRRERARDRDESRRLEDGVAAEAVVFPSGDVPLAGMMYRPAHVGGALPGVVVTGTWTSVRQQMADRYAARLAARGYAALAFDHTGYGSSGGTVRDYESPSLKIRDIRSAVDALAARRDVDSSRIGSLAICASAGYTIGNAVDDPRVRAVAMIAPWLHDARIVEDTYGGADGVAERMRNGALARARYERDPRDLVYVPAVDAHDTAAAMPTAIDFYLDPHRGGIPEWPNRFAVMAWPGWLTWDPIALAPQVRQPLLVLHSEDAAIPEGAKRFIDSTTTTVDAVWRKGTQFDFYDNDDNVDDAVERTSAHFGRVLT